MRELRYLWQNASNGQDRCGPRLFARSALVLALIAVPVFLPALLMLYVRPPIAEWTHGPTAILTFAVLATLFVVYMVGLPMLWLTSYHLCRRRANDSGLTERLRRLSRIRDNVMSVCNGLAGCILFVFTLPLAFLAVDLRLSMITFLIFGAPLFFFARHRSYPGPNPYGPIPSEVLP